jgi:dihydrofolate reductase
MDIKFTVFIAASLDGFIARTNDKLDWLDAAGDKDSKEDYGYQQYMSSVDCIVMGRRTFEKVALFSQWPYEHKRVIVLSKSLKKIPNDFEDKVSLFSNNVELLGIELQSYGFKKIYVDGGKTIQSFIRAELIDEIILTQIPILLGKGISLFGEVTKDVRLKLLNSKSYSTGFVQSKYEIERYASKYFD